MKLNDLSRQELLEELNTLKSAYQALEKRYSDSVKEKELDDNLLYPSILSASPDVITITDLEGRILFSSPKAVAMFGLMQPEDANGRNLLEFLSERDHSLAMENLGKMFQGIFRGATEYIGRRLDGTLFDIEVNGEFIRNSQGEPTGLVFVTRDITERKTVQARLRQNEENFRYLVETINDTIYEISVDGTIAYVSPAIEKMLGFTPAELIGECFFDYMLPDDVSVLKKALSQLGTKDNSYLEYRYQTKTGKYKWVRSSTTPIYDDGVVIGGTGSLTDIHDRKIAEDELRKLSRAVEQSPVSIVITNLDGIIEYANPKACETTGYSLLELQGQNPRVLKSGETGVGEYTRLWNTIANGQTWQGIFHNKKKNGAFYWESSVISPIMDQHGNITHYLAVKEDITARKHTEEALVQSENRFRQLAEQSQTVIWEVNAKGLFTFVNEMSLKVWGYQPDELIGKKYFYDLHPEENRQQYKERVLESFARMVDFKNITNQVVTKSGSLIYVLTNGIPIRGAAGELIGYRGADNDITDAKIKDIELNKLSKAIDQSPVLIVITDLQGKVEYVNPAFEQTTGYLSGEIIGQPTNILKSGQTSKETYRQMWQTISSGKEWHHEWINKKKNGELFWESILISPIFAESGEIVNYLAVKQDISSRKQAEREILDLNINLEARISERTLQLAETNQNLIKEIEERKILEENLRRAQQEAEQANQAKSEFLSRMSHELRTPMNSILGFAQLLDMHPLDPGQKKGVQHILKSGKHLLDLINEVLDISRIEAGQLSLSIEPVQIRGVLAEIVDLAEPQVVSKEIKIEIVDTEEYDLFLQCDKQRLKQVLLNLLNNAIKYNFPGGKVFISADQKNDESSKSDFVRIYIRDTGPGISAGDLPKLFNPFERIGAEKSTIEGTGLGLSVVKKLVDVMGGNVGVESEINQGSTFWIEFPVAKGPYSHKGIISELDSQEPMVEERSGTILYIEDNSSNIELVDDLLQSQRSKIQMVSNAYGMNAVSLAIQYRPSLILLDLNLPDMHGSTVLQQLQENEMTKEIPVAVISADAMPQQIERLIELGARRYLTKPIDLSLLLKIIDDYFN